MRGEPLCPAVSLLSTTNTKSAFTSPFDGCTGMERRGGCWLVLCLLAVSSRAFQPVTPRPPPRPLLQDVAPPSSPPPRRHVAPPRHNHTASTSLLPTSRAPSHKRLPQGQSQSQSAPRRALDCHGEVTRTRSEQLAQDLHFWSLALFLASSPLVWPDEVTAAADNGAQPTKVPPSSSSYKAALAKASKRAIGGKGVE